MTGDRFVRSRRSASLSPRPLRSSLLRSTVAAKPGGGGGGGGLSPHPDADPDLRRLALQQRRLHLGDRPRT